MARIRSSWAEDAPVARLQIYLSAVCTALWCQHRVRDPEHKEVSQGVAEEHRNGEGTKLYVHSNGQTEAQVKRLKLVKRQAICWQAA